MENLVNASQLKKQVNMKEIAQHLNSIILAANESGKKNTRTYGLRGEFSGSSLYNKTSPLVEEVIAALRANGFRADIRFDMKQFVDIYLYIEWV